MLEYLKLKKREALDFFSSLKSRVLKIISKACAHLWHHFLWSKYYVQTGFSKYKWKIVWTSILVFVGLNIAFLSKIDPLLFNAFP